MTTKSRDAGSICRGWYNHTSLTVKMVILTIVVGISLWALMDHIQSSKLKKIFYVKLVEELTEQSIQWRQKLDRHIRSYNELSELFTTQKKFTDYIMEQNWSVKDPIQIKHYDHHPPPWFLENSLLRLLAHPRYALLMDQEGNVREVFSHHEKRPPPALLKPTQLMLVKSHGQSLITEIENSLHLVASHSFKDSLGNILGTLILASPVDEEFLSTATGSIPGGYLIALASMGKEPQILISSDQTELSPGTPLINLENRFLIVGEHTYNYGAAEYIIKLVSFISMNEVDKMTAAVISTARQQRNIVAPSLILIFTLIMLFITRKINLLNRKMSDFSQKTLGVSKQTLSTGDQLHLLDRRFERLTEEVIEAREMVKREAEEKNQLIVQNAFDAIVTTDSNNIIRTWNPKAEIIFGWKREEVIGKTGIDLIIPERYREEQKNAIKNYRADHSTTRNIPIEFAALHRSGHEFPAELTLSSVRSDNNYLFIAIIRDITERKKSEEELKASHERLLTVLDSLDAIVYVADMDTHEILFINKYTQNAFGNIEGEICWQALQEGQSGPCSFCTNDKLITPEGVLKGIYTWEFQNTINDKWYFIHDRAIKWMDDRNVRLEIATDITKLKLVEKKTRKSLGEKEVLLREIHHRVKNNMQIISSLINLQSQHVTDKQYMEMFIESRNRIRSMALVHEKLYLSNDLTNVNFSDYVNSLANELLVSVNTHNNISLKTNLDKICLPIDTAIPCGLIINELLTNSFKHAFPANEKGEIQISFTDKENHNGNGYTLTISDNGVGIPEDLNIRKTKSLGLQLITNLTEHQLRGKIELTRSQGTTFKIFFNDLDYSKRI